MNETPQALQELHEALQASPVAEYFVKIKWENWPTMLSIRNAWGGEYNDIIVHIEVDKDGHGNFSYEVLSNKGLTDPEQYLTVEEKKGVSSKTILEVACRLLTPQE